MSSSFPSASSPLIFHFWGYSANANRKGIPKCKTTHLVLVWGSFRAGGKLLCRQSAGCCCAPDREQTPSSREWSPPRWPSSSPGHGDRVPASPGPHPVVNDNKEKFFIKADRETFTILWILSSQFFALNLHPLTDDNIVWVWRYLHLSDMKPSVLIVEINYYR